MVDVIIIGAGTAGLSAAIYVQRAGKKALVLEESTYGGQIINTADIENYPGIEPRNMFDTWNDRLQSIEVTDKNTGETKTLNVDALFVAIGQIPMNQIFSDIVELDERGFIKTDEECRTSAKGIYAAGDCRVKTVRQLTTAASDGAIAALNACNTL